MAWLERRRASGRMDQLPPLGAGRPGGSAQDGDVPRGRHVAGVRSRPRLERAGHRRPPGAERRSADGAPAWFDLVLFAQQPSQAWFESQLLQRLRAVDPRRPVWVGDVDAQVGELQLPGSMADALGAAPAAPLEAPIEERVNRWIEDEPAWASPSDAVDAIASWSPPPEGRLIERWRDLSLRELAGLVASVLTDYLDRRQCRPTVATDGQVECASRRWWPTRSSRIAWRWRYGPGNRRLKLRRLSRSTGRTRRQGVRPAGDSAPPASCSCAGSGS